MNFLRFLIDVMQLLPLLTHLALLVRVTDADLVDAVLPWMKVVLYADGISSIPVLQLIRAQRGHSILLIIAEVISVILSFVFWLPRNPFNSS